RRVLFRSAGEKRGGIGVRGLGFAHREEDIARVLVGRRRLREMDAREQDVLLGGERATSQLARLLERAKGGRGLAQFVENVRCELVGACVALVDARRELERLSGLLELVALDET